jgi:hypothetical protein
MNSNIYILGGRRYRMVEAGTLEHLIWMDVLIADSGLRDSLFAPVPATPAGTGDFAGKVWDQLSKSGRIFDYLGGMLIPTDLQDEDWTPAIAAESAARFKKLTDPADHARIRSILIALVIGFFEAALPWRQVSATVSASEEGADLRTAHAMDADDFSAISGTGAP